MPKVHGRSAAVVWFGGVTTAVTAVGSHAWAGGPRPGGRGRVVGGGARGGAGGGSARGAGRVGGGKARPGQRRRGRPPGGQRRGGGRGGGVRAQMGRPPLPRRAEQRQTAV